MSTRSTKDKRAQAGKTDIAEPQRLMKVRTCGWEEADARLRSNAASISASPSAAACAPVPALRISCETASMCLNFKSCLCSRSKSAGITQRRRPRSGFRGADPAARGPIRTVFNMIGVV
jgi:hypothetical protein